jgi:polyferredoxin
MRKYAQPVLQGVFLALFVLLTLTGRVQLWMGIFAASVLAALLLGRGYCGWVCPINTGMRAVGWVKRKLGLKSAKVPRWLTKPWVRVAALGLFLAAFLFTMVSGRKLPVLPALLALGVLLTLAFPPELWHRHLCPYGLILSLPARASRGRLAIDPALCNGCGSCRRVCPAKAVEKEEGRYRILKQDCLLCMDCVDVCKQKAIRYGTGGESKGGQLYG